MLLTNHALTGLATRKLSTILGLGLIITGIFSYRHFVPNKSLAGTWITDCSHYGFYIRQAVTISESGVITDSASFANSESCDTAPSIISHSKQNLTGIENLPKAILMMSGAPVLVKIQTDSMVLVANMLHIYEFNDWEKGIERNVLGKKFSWMPWAQTVGEMTPRPSLAVSYNGDNQILITGTTDNKPFILTRQ